MFGESLPVSNSGLNGRLEGGEVDAVQVAAAEAVDERLEEVGWVGWLRVGEGEEGCLRGVGRGMKSCSRSHTLLLDSWLLPRQQRGLCCCCQPSLRP